MSTLVKAAMDQTKEDEESKENLTKTYTDYITRRNFNDYTKFKELLNNGLENLGITNLEHCRLIMKEIQLFQEGNNFTHNNT